MQMTTATYTLSSVSPASFEYTLERVRAELHAEGFGVLCEIDVQATLKNKIGVDREPYIILGACNPPLAHQALEHEAELGALLPCNVIIYTEDGACHVSAIDAARMLALVGNDQLAPIAEEVGERLSRVVERATSIFDEGLPG
jgi:uncharacterized protein (DUF302 family)